MASPRILAVDTATDTCSVALLLDDRVNTRSEVVGQRHSERALSMIDALLNAAGLRLEEVDLIAFGAGPGSFTGLRIACGLAQGLAWGIDRSVIPVGNLRALAERVFRESAASDRVLCAVDARMHEAYCAIYHRDPRISEVQPPSLAKPADLARLADEVDTVAGDALMVFPEALQALQGKTLLPRLRADAADIAQVAATPEFLEQAVAPHLAAPLYVRDQVASTIEQRRARAGAR